MSSVGLIGHQALVEWRGEQVLTLADLIPERPRAVVVGINPAPKSVAVGHYYQGRLGQMFFARLRTAGVLPLSDGSWDDDQAFAAGLGFTDIVKRPTASAADLRREEFTHGADRLLARLEAVGHPCSCSLSRGPQRLSSGASTGQGCSTSASLGLRCS